MSDTQDKLGVALLKSLVEIKEQKGALSLGDIGSIFMQVASSLTPPLADADRIAHQEIAQLAKYIDNAKKEIFSISVHEKSEKAIMDASQHLDEVIKETEVASHTIMDAADAILSAAKGAGGEREQKIATAINRIYEACNFQDVNGQRITKVIKLLNTIEETVDRLNVLFYTGNEAAPAKKVTTPASDKDLLNGPQLAANAPSQAEIDALFATLSEKS